MIVSVLKKQTGFTIVELLIVIVVIGILAAITVAAYTGIQQNAKKALLTSDLTNASKLIKLDQTLDGNGNFPATIVAANEGKGISGSSGTTLRYSVNNTANPKTFCLTATDSRFAYMITDSTAPSEGSCVNVAQGATAPSAILVDGVTSTTPWHGPGVGLQSVTVTLAAAQDVSSVKVWHYYGDSRTYYATRTEVSEDGTNWQTVFDSATSSTYQETSAGKTHTFPMRKVRYIRDWLNGSTSNTSNHWVEIQAY